MKNDVGDKSPNDVATEWLIVGETLALVPLRSICRGGYHPPEKMQFVGEGLRALPTEERRMAKLLRSLSAE